MKRIWMLAAVVLLAAGCGGPSGLSKGVSVSHYTAEGADFSGMRTFSWVPLIETIASSDFPQDVLVSMKVAFTDALVARGFTQTANTPDLFVALYLSRNGRIQSTDWGYNYRWDEQSWSGYWQERRVSTREYEEGTLVLDLIDARKQELAWSGTATAVLRAAESGEARNKRIDEAVEKLFAEVPFGK